MPTIFVSHASADRELAIRVKTLLASSLRQIPDLRVFCSSDAKDLKGGKKWFDQIMENLKNSTACVALMTPESVLFSPWVAYECGGAYLQFEIHPSRSRLFPACARGMTSGILPQPFNELQVRSLDNFSQVDLLCHEIAELFKLKSAEKRPRLMQAVVAEALRGSGDWAFVHRTLIGQRQASSPFRIENLIEQANSQVFCAGFNLYYVATTPAVKKALFGFLQGSRSRSVHLMISDPAQRNLFKGWRMVGQSFLQDLDRSANSFRGWLAEAKRKKIQGQLQIKLADFVALTITCIDPDSRNGQMVITPSIPNKPHSADRPHVWLSKQRHSAEFSYYWDVYHDLFLRAHSL